MTCPFTGEEYVVMKALTPDVSVVHVQVDADPFPDRVVVVARNQREELDPARQLERVEKWRNF